MVESLIFVILGVMIVNPTVDASGTHSFWQSWNTPFAFAALGLVFVVRFVGRLNFHVNNLKMQSSTFAKNCPSKNICKIGIEDLRNSKQFSIEGSVLKK